MNFSAKTLRYHALTATIGIAALLGGNASATPTYTLINSGSLNRSTYEVWMSDSALTWTEANNYANNSRNAKLVSINSIAENSFVANLINNPILYTNAVPSHPGGLYAGPYIGLRRSGPTTGSIDPKSGWQWVDGTPLTPLSPLWNLWYDVNHLGGQPDTMQGDDVAIYYNGTTSGVNTWGDIYDGVTILPEYGGGPNLFLMKSFVVEKVPGPIPAIGALAAFRWSRLLRRRHRHLAERRVVSGERTV
ncbi:MAG: C-type lectin domain-containing protein [Synechococcaceae cyanobacterium]|nr:C-type lectin domain-containing protein [Synechococcaceae cyanobacterium]